MQKSDLALRIRNSLLRLTTVYIAICFVVVSSALVASFLYHQALARSFSTSVYNSLAIRDLRQVITQLNPLVGNLFSEIRFLNSNGVTEFQLPPTEVSATDKQVSQKWYWRDIEIPIVPVENPSGIGTGTSNETDVDRKSNSEIGKLIFSFNWIRWPLQSAIVCLLMSLVLRSVYLRERRAIGKRYAEEIRRQKAELFSEVATQVSHDIRSPLSALNVTVARISGLIPAEEKQILSSAAKRINDIANDLLAKNKELANESLSQDSNLMPGSSATKAIKLDLEMIDLSVLVRDVMQEKQREYSDRNDIDWQLDVPALTPGDASSPVAPAAEWLCYVDQKEVARVVSNLLNNSVEASIDQQRTNRIKLGLRRSNNSVTVYISDTGRGISEEVLPLLGAKVISHGKASGLGSSGSGRGLFHAKQVIEKMRGRFSIQSKVGEGTIVTLDFTTENKARSDHGGSSHAGF